MPASSDPSASDVGASDETVEGTVTLAADLHARPAGQLSVAAARFQSSIRLLAAGRESDAKSVLAVMQLGASAGTAVTIRAAGPDARPAVDTLIALLEAVTA